MRKHEDFRNRVGMMVQLPTIEVRLLGPLAVDVDGRRIEGLRRKERALLVALALRTGRFVGSDELIEALWGERPPASARHALHVYVSQVRRALGEAGHWLERSERSYQLHLEPASTDRARFLAATKAGRAALVRRDWALACDLLDEAIGEWQDDPLVDAPDDRLAQAEARALQEDYLIAVEDQLEAKQELGDRDLVPELERLTARYPGRERLWAELMVALYRVNRQAEALGTYALARKTLIDEFGIEPSKMLKELERAILKQDSRLSASSTGGGRVTGLPEKPTLFIGREREVASVVALFEEPTSRLITLVGEAGVGKTRLAMRASQVFAERGGSDVTFVSLAGITPADGILGAIADSLVTDARDPDALARFLAERNERSTLVILDGFEDVFEARSIVVTLLEKASSLKLIVTSRSPLAVPGETRFSVGPRPGERNVGTRVEPSDASGAAGGGVVLLVENDENSRDDAHRTLAASGYEVIPARYVTEALEIWQQQKGSIDLVLSDLVMPGMSGGDLAIRIAAEHPRTPILLLSSDALPHSVPLVEQGRARLIAKPFTSEELLAAAHEALATSRSKPPPEGTSLSGTIGLIVDWTTWNTIEAHPFWRHVIEGLRSGAVENGYELQPLERGADAKPPLDRCLEADVDGAIVLAYFNSHVGMQRMVESELPCVAIDVALVGPRTVQIASDNVQGAALAVHHLYKCGYRRIAHISGYLDSKVGADRLTGYQRAIEELELEYRYVAPSDFVQGYEPMQALLATQDPPDSIFVASDLMAARSLRALNEAKIRVPDEIGVVGFDDIEIAILVDPPLTTVRQDGHELGRLAVQTIREIVEGKRPPPSIALPVQLVTRASTRPAR